MLIFANVSIQFRCKLSFNGLFSLNEAKVVTEPAAAAEEGKEQAARAKYGCLSSFFVWFCWFVWFWCALTTFQVPLTKFLVGKGVQIDGQKLPEEWREMLIAAINNGQTFLWGCVFSCVSKPE